MKGAEAVARRALEVTREGAWLVARFACEHDVASWAIVGGGVACAKAVAWHRVRDEELRPPMDARALLRDRMARAGLDGAVGLLTSRDLDAWVEATCAHGDAAATCVATVGLGNALRAGDLPGPSARIGTINLLVRVSEPLTTEALVETIAIASEAKAAATIEARVASRRSGRPATGTGTDCIVVAAPVGATKKRYAGKHTALGHVVGACVEEAVARGASGWRRERQGRT